MIRDIILGFCFITVIGLSFILSTMNDYMDNQFAKQCSQITELYKINEAYKESLVVIRGEMQSKMWGKIKAMPQGKKAWHNFPK